jgi:NAD(P)-dependent dehydrogenase (short-subunit alcohol dehydrogenase family)
MKYELSMPAQNGGRAYVLGAVKDSNNIGDHVAQRFAMAGYVVTGDDGAAADGPVQDERPRGVNMSVEERERLGYGGPNKWTRYQAPSVQDFAQANPDVLVITLGRTSKEHFAETPGYDIENMIRANLVLPLEAAHRFVQATIRTQDLLTTAVRKIIFVGSYAHDHPFTNGTLYCAAKAGLNMAARTLAWELTDRGYRIHVVNPYHVNGTPMWTQVEKDVMKSKGMSWEEADAYNRKDLKMPDLLTPEEVAEVIFDVANRKSMDWVTGPINLYGGSR